MRLRAAGDRQSACQRERPGHYVFAPMRNKLAVESSTLIAENVPRL